MNSLYKTMMVAAAAMFVTTGAFADNYSNSKTMRDDQASQSSRMEKRMQYSTLSASDIQEVQRSLRDEGHSISVDGIWGPQTTEAVRAFQRNNDLNATGDLDSKTLTKLEVDVNRYNN